ncbi:sensor histidine kinase [Roseateles paludis]|jgi:LytS/YehU family sensor histidine kinase|uniref:Histidine kinase n=1 Tax=Roseateles paludis TaxID=3145238 RepID=A0ABV0G5Y1_9BURK
MSRFAVFRQALRNQGRLTKHRTDPAWARVAVYLLWLTGFTLVFAVSEGLKHKRLGQELWWTLDLPSHLVLAACITSTFFAAFRSFELGVPARWIDTIMAWRDWRTGLFFSSFSVACSAVGMLIGLRAVDLIWNQQNLPTVTSNGTFWGSFLGVAIIITALAGLLYRARWRREALQARATEAQLKLLQAQIEPHFLFNTLANVQSLIDHDPATAKLMLERFTDYLRASLQQLRHEASTLAQELTMAEAYLSLMQIRMQDRLRFRIECEPDLASQPLPPLLIQPLIENAIHHGLEPQIKGGELVVKAWRAGGELVIDVLDDGRGLDAATRSRRRGNGVALANIRERLQNRWGPQASLVLSQRFPDHTPAGTCARLRVPLSPIPKAPEACL